MDLLDTPYIEVKQLLLPLLEADWDDGRFGERGRPENVAVTGTVTLERERIVNVKRIRSLFECLEDRVNLCRTRSRLPALVIDDSSDDDRSADEAFSTPRGKAAADRSPDEFMKVTDLTPSTSALKTGPAEKSKPELPKKDVGMVPATAPRWSYPGFVGIKAKALKDQQASELTNLTRLAMAGRWESLQTHHGKGFDWWMFPIDQDSQHGDKWRVSPSDIEVLKADAEFMASYREGAILVARSWGWDLKKNQKIHDPKLKWAGWDVRLGKMACSLYLFGQKDLHASLLNFIDKTPPARRIRSDNRWRRYLLPIA